MKRNFRQIVGEWLGVIPLVALVTIVADQATDTVLRLIMSQEGCHGTTAEVFSRVQA